jgi:hypothetical protein
MLGMLRWHCRMTRRVIVYSLIVHMVMKCLRYIHVGYEYHVSMYTVLYSAPTPSIQQQQATTRPCQFADYFKGQQWRSGDDIQLTVTSDTLTYSNQNTYMSATCVTVDDTHTMYMINAQSHW